MTVKNKTTQTERKQSDETMRHTWTRHKWLEGDDWLTGLTRTGVKKTQTGNATESTENAFNKNTKLMSQQVKR